LGNKLDRLTDVKMILVENSAEDIYPYLSEYLHPVDEELILKIYNIEAICEKIIKEYKSSLAPILGLVLSGGQSKRMGTDKSKIEYHGKAQSEYMADMLSQHTEETFISVTHDYSDTSDDNHKIIKDSYLGLGPIGGILSAFRYNPDAAWLTVACDLPYLTEDTIMQLVNERDTAKLATCFYNSATDTIEPLITIWEPRAYPAMLDYLSMGYASPSKVLLDHDINLIEIKNPKALTNANDPLQKKTAMEDIEKNLLS
jgi:molybdenum cofactor guanylyltransferase